MGIKKYFVNHNGQNVGPYDLAKINELILQEQLTNQDKIYLDEQDKWIMVCEHPDFAPKKEAPVPQSAVTASKPKAKLNSVKVKSDDQWFILQGEERQGPYEFSDLVRLLQEKALFEYNFVWRTGMENWQRVAEVPEFSAENIRQFLKSEKELFLRRKHIRLSYQCPIVAHDNKNHWAGYTMELSESGAGIVIENAMLMPGDNIYLHFKPGTHTKSFNVLCEVVSKKYINNIKENNSPMVYGVKFINIPKSEKDLIKALSAQAA